MTRPRGESYRPSYVNNTNGRGNEHQARPHDRPNLPAHSNSRFGNTFSHLSKDFRTPKDTTSHSPHPPQTNNEELSNTTIMSVTAVSTDPRRREPARETSHVVTSITNSKTNTLEDYIRQLTRQFFHEEKAQNAEAKVKLAQQKEQEMKELFPDRPAVVEEVEKKRKKAETALSDCLRRATDFKDQAMRTFASLPTASRDLVHGVSPTSNQTTKSDTFDELTSSVKNLSEKLENLTKRNREQEADLRKLKEESLKPTSQDFESKVHSKVLVACDDINKRLAVCDEKVQKHKNDSAMLFSAVDEHKGGIQRQNNEIATFRSEQSKLTESVKYLQKKAEQIEIEMSHRSNRDTLRSPPDTGREDEIAEIKQQQKEQKLQFANLSNTFVSCRDFEESRSKTDAMRSSIEESLKENAQAHLELMKKVSDIDNKTNQASIEIDKVKSNAKEFSVTDSKAMQQQVKNLLTSQGMIRHDLERLSERFTELSVAQESNVLDAQASASNAVELSQLKVEVGKLKSSDEQHNHLCVGIQKRLAEVDKQNTDLRKKANEFQNSARFRLDSIDDSCKDNQKATVDCVKQYKLINAQLEETGAHQTQVYADLHSQMSELNKSTTQKIEPILAQIALAVTDIKALKSSTEQVSHSIQSLDTRYSAISTQKLHHSIVATIQPLLPHIFDLKEQVKKVQAAVTTWEQQTAQIEDKVRSIETTNIDGVGDASRTEIAIEQPTTSEHDQTAGHQQQDSGLQEVVTSLREDSNDHATQLHKLQTDLSALRQMLENQAQSVVDTDRLAEEMRKLEDESTKRQTDKSTTFDTKILEQHNQFRITLDDLKTKAGIFQVSLKEIKDLVDGLRADVGVVEDLQSRIQNAQTDITTHQTQIDRIETDLLRIGTVEQRLNQWQAKSEQKPEDARIEVLQTKVETIRKDTIELRHQGERVNNILFSDKFPAKDRYILCDNISSAVKEDMVQERFKGCDVKAVQIGGDKSANGTTTTRYILVWVKPSSRVDATIDAIIRKQEETGAKWHGRRPLMRKIHRDLFAQIWLTKPASIKDIAADLPTPMAPPNDKAPNVPVLPGTERDASTSRSARSEIPDDTIEVVRSEDAPRKPSVQKDITGLPDSDGESLLVRFRAKRDGQRTTKPEGTSRVESSAPATPSVRLNTKRAAPEVSSSRPSSKRNRRE